MTTALITGATSGLGRLLAQRLAGSEPDGWTVLVHGRDRGRREQLADELRAAGESAEPYGADLASLAEVAALADTVATEHPELDVLVNNAGVGFGEPGADREVSRDGHELRFAVNYLAPVLLTRRLLPTLRKNAGSRVVHVGSAGQAELDFDDPELERSYDGILAYRRSKLALVMFTLDMAAELAAADAESPTVNCLHPETFMDTTMVRDAGIGPVSSVADGADNVLALLYGPAARGVTGQYFDRAEPARALAQAYDPAARRRLREITDRALADYER